MAVRDSSGDRTREPALGSFASFVCRFPDSSGKGRPRVRLRRQMGGRMMHGSSFRWNSGAGLGSFSSGAGARVSGVGLGSFSWCAGWWVSGAGLGSFSSGAGARVSGRGLGFVFIGRGSDGPGAAHCSSCSKTAMSSVQRATVLAERPYFIASCEERWLPSWPMGPGDSALLRLDTHLCNADLIEIDLLLETRVQGGMARQRVEFPQVVDMAGDIFRESL